MGVGRCGVLAPAAFGFVMACGGATGRDHDRSAVGTGAAAGQSANGAGGQNGGASGTAGTAQTGGFAGTSPRDCAEIEKDYDAALSDARRCSLEISSPQCTTIKETGLRCSCPDVVNERNPDAIALLDVFYDEYVAAGCQDIVSCKCFAPPDPGGYPCSTEGFCDDPAP